MTGFDVKRLALVLAKQAEIEAMKAKNIERESQGYSLAYNEESFFEAAEELRNIAAAHDHQL